MEQMSAQTAPLVPRRRQSLGPGPWRAAIAYWLDWHGATQADLARATKLRASTVSLAARGHFVHTRTLQRIADALRIDIEDVLVSPLHRNAVEDRRRLAVEAAEIALRAGDRVPRRPPTNEGLRELELAERHARPPVDDAASIAAQIDRAATKRARPRQRQKSR